MTIEELIQMRLEENGLARPDAREVLMALKAEPSQEAMKGRWTDSADGYPRSLLAIVWVVAKQEALKWIDDNLPRHWARPMFEEEEGGEEGC